MAAACKAWYTARLYAANSLDGDISGSLDAPVNIALSVAGSLAVGAVPEQLLAACSPAGTYSTAMQGNIEVAINVLALLHNTNPTPNAF